MTIGKRLKELHNKAQVSTEIKFVIEMMAKALEAQLLQNKEDCDVTGIMSVYIPDYLEEQFVELCAREDLTLTHRTNPPTGEHQWLIKLSDNIL